ncbi:P-loop containing nucleoside triphosphate hydrolase protein [Irpex rosettiformis]|uniref:P-loop containing nucleoside triphosphate hydrolase protein n=1 Tax=Irpex rosettiformis TaxID=378272 RepID=A0ACB8UF10_9APHY|nr:P-loop containing nucleoside triphosphate hydrolase protein [Irpex rosettiformis]
MASPSYTLGTPSTIWPVHIEVRVSQDATARFDTIRNTVHQYIISSFSHIYLPSSLQGWEEIPLLATSVERIMASESPCQLASLPIEQISLQIHVYQPIESDAFEELTDGSNRNDGEEVMAASVCELPSIGWEGLWESLIYSDDIKAKLLDYIYATVVFSDAEVDFNVVSWNRVVLLHGPPGTGKTSLCRALAQKLSIRLADRYPHSKLLEINSHSLFSRWFSESGKLVQRLFSTVTDMVEDEDTFVVVLIDEVESLTSARAGAMSGTEPSDALRVVNALLTQLDKLKHRKNVLVMSTSNLAKAIAADTAFVDRADIIQYVDLPSRDAIYAILRSCVSELVTKGIVTHIDVPSLAQAQLYERTADLSSGISIAPPASSLPIPFSQNLPPDINNHTESTFSSQPHIDSSDAENRRKAKNVAISLLSLAEKCRAQGMSGRSLRRLPVLAHARYIGSMTLAKPRQPRGINDEACTSATDVMLWLQAMEKVVDAQAIERGRLQHAMS